MAGTWDKLLSRRLIAALSVLSFGFAAGGWLWAWWTLRARPYSLILHFNNLVHVNQAGDVRDLVGIGVFGLLVVLVNSMVAFELDQRDWFWGKLLAAGTLAFSLLIFIGFAAIVSVN